MGNLDDDLRRRDFAGMGPWGCARLKRAMNGRMKYFSVFAISDMLFLYLNCFFLFLSFLISLHNTKVLVNHCNHVVKPAFRHMSVRLTGEGCPTPYCFDMGRLEIMSYRSVTIRRLMVDTRFLTSYAVPYSSNSDVGISSWRLLKKRKVRVFPEQK